MFPQRKEHWYSKEEDPWEPMKQVHTRCYVNGLQRKIKRKEKEKAEP
jgi:hypothetical protein